MEDAEYAKCDKCKSINKVMESNLNEKTDNYINENENNFNVQVPYMVFISKMFNFNCK